jgi:DNA repair protein RecO (recombination protein O)
MPDRQRVYRTHAVVLRRRDYRDADRILTVFTPTYGKLELIAKGVRKTTSRKAGHLELFGHSVLQIAQARTWDIITEALNVDSFTALRADLDKISHAGYLSELVDSFTQTDDENLPIWELLISALQTVNDALPESDAHLLLHWFELHLLSLAGFQPQLFQCLECDEELQPVLNYISLAEGGVLCPRCAEGRRDAEPIEPEVLKVLRFLQSRPWSIVSQVQVHQARMQRVDNLLYRYLLNVLERQLRSVDFMRRLEHLRPTLSAAAPTTEAANHANP